MKRSDLARHAIADLNGEKLPDLANLKAFHGSTAVRVLHQGMFRTRDGKRYAVNKNGEIRRTDKLP